MHLDYPINILLVDDQPENLVALESILVEENYVLVRANSGEEALRHILKNEFALIVLDVEMPGMDGFETTDTIMKRFPKEKRPLIIAMTASISEKDKQRSSALGMVDFVSKPIKVKNITDMLERHFSKYQKV